MPLLQTVQIYLLTNLSANNITSLVNNKHADALTNSLNQDIPIVYVDGDGEIYLLRPKNVEGEIVRDPLEFFYKIQNHGAAARITNAANQHILNHHIVALDDKYTLGAIIHQRFELDFLKVAIEMRYTAEKVSESVLSRQNL